MSATILYKNSRYVSVVQGEPTIITVWCEMHLACIVVETDFLVASFQLRKGNWNLTVGQRLLICSQCCMWLLLQSCFIWIQLGFELGPLRSIKSSWFPETIAFWSGGWMFVSHFLFIWSIFVLSYWISFS